jgi:hypothetical protein
MFGKSLAQYLDFQKSFLALIAVVGLARLALSLAGLPHTTVRWLSMNAVFWAGLLYAGVAVHTRGFGGYRQLLPLGIAQTVLMQAIAVLGILLSIAGASNIYAAPEFSFGVRSQWLHALSHVTVGIVVPPFVFWGAASLVLLATRSLARRPAAA